MKQQSTTTETADVEVVDDQTPGNAIHTEVMQKWNL